MMNLINVTVKIGINNHYDYADDDNGDGLWSAIEN